MARNYYDILGVGADADTGTIHAAWREKAKQLHPDRNKGADAHDSYVLVNQAYETLSDPVKRREYDLALFAPQARAQSDFPGAAQFNESVRQAQMSATFAADFDDGPSLSDVLAGMVDGIASNYVGGNPLFRAAYKKVRKDVHARIKDVLGDDRRRRARA